MAINITRGERKRAQKIVKYGPEGVGKTTIASEYPEPLFADCEGGTDHLDVARVEIKTIADFRETCIFLLREPHEFQTLVVDTIDWLAARDVEEMLKEDDVESVETYGFGKGYKKAEERFNGIIRLLDRVIAKGINVVLLGHSKITKFEEPDKGGSYDRYSMKLEKKIEPLVKEWSDCLLFLNYETRIVERQKGQEGKKRGISTNKRIFHAARDAAYDAKNRHGLPDKFEATIENLKPVFQATEGSLKAAEEKAASESKETEKTPDSAEQEPESGTVVDEATAEESTNEATGENKKALDAIVDKAGGIEAVEAFLKTRDKSLEDLDDVNGEYVSIILQNGDNFAKKVAEHSRESNK